MPLGSSVALRPHSVCPQYPLTPIPHSTLPQLQSAPELHTLPRESPGSLERRNAVVMRTEETEAMVPSLVLLPSSVLGKGSKWASWSLAIAIDRDSQKPNGSNRGSLTRNIRKINIELHLPFSRRGCGWSNRTKQMLPYTVWLVAIIICCLVMQTLSAWASCPGNGWSPAEKLNSAFPMHY